MPIVPPGSVYSPGDEIAEALSIIGGSIPALLDPRRGVRNRVQEYMEDPTKIEALAKRLYPQAITVDSVTGVPYVDDEKRKQVIRDAAVSFGLNPDNEREYGVIGPMLDAAMTALPADFKVDVEMGMMGKTRERIAKEKSSAREANIAESDVRGLKAQSEGRYLAEIARAGGDVQQAKNDLAKIGNETFNLGRAERLRGDVAALGLKDPTLQALLSLDPDGQQAALYLRELRMQELAALSRMRNGQSSGLTVPQIESFITERRSALSEIRERIDTAQAEGADPQTLQRLVSEYNSIAAEWVQFGKALFAQDPNNPLAQLAQEQHVAIPRLATDKRSVLGVDVLAKDVERGRVVWTTPAIPAIPGVSIEDAEDFQHTLIAPDGVILLEPESADQRLVNMFGIETAPLRDYINRMTYSEAIDWLTGVELETGVTLPKFRNLVKMTKSGQQRGEELIEQERMKGSMDWVED